MAFVFKSSLRWKLIRVRIIDDIDRNLVLTDLVYKGTSIGSHPVFFFKLEIKKPKFSILAIVGTSDGATTDLKIPKDTIMSKG